ncbi:MAG: hypothetical protein MUF75_12390 [Bacteroidia bacterium]|jgi:hypothetical protein|nr:hypothetical protein [Bacteroidia bacterium]
MRTWIFILFFAFAACSDPVINYVARVKLHYLTIDDIYEPNKVKDMLFDAEERNIDSLRRKSREYFLSGVDAFRNRNKIDEAIPDFKRSILCLPDAKTYYELGSALLSTAKWQNDYKEAANAFMVAEELDFKPKSLLLYKLACAHNMARDHDDHFYDVSNCLLRAFSEGFNDTVALIKDPFLSSFVQSSSYKQLLLNVGAAKWNNKPVELFNVFVSAFPKVENTTFEIKPEQVGMSDYKNSISFDFVRFVPEMQSSSFGRDVSHDFIYVASVAETPIYHVLIYNSVSYYGEQFQPIYTKLVTYNKSGGIIAAKILAGQFSAEKIKSGRIENNQITITDYKRIWERAITELSPEENKVLKYEVIATAKFRIQEDGTIIEESVPNGFKDSLLLVKQ